MTALVHAMCKLGLYGLLYCCLALMNHIWAWGRKKAPVRK